MIFVVSLTFSSFFLFFKSKSPLPSALILVITSGLSAMYAGITCSKWIMSAIFLIFLGGMMVMFLYVCTLSMNEKFFISLKPPIMIIPVTCLTLIPMQTPQSQSSLFLCVTYSSSWNLSILFLVLYLGCTLFLCVKSIQSFKGALTKLW